MQSYDASVPLEKMSVFVDNLATHHCIRGKSITGGAYAHHGHASIPDKEFGHCFHSGIAFYSCDGIGIKASNLETIGTKATYATVLVVFVRTKLPVIACDFSQHGAGVSRRL